MTDDIRDRQGAAAAAARPVWRERRFGVLGPFHIGEGGFLDAPSLDGVTGWARLRGASITSLVLWLVITFLGSVLPNV